MSAVAAASLRRSTAWPVVPLSQVCTFKPSKAICRKRLADDSEVSFVPMNDLGELVKYFEPKDTRSFGEVVKSYTYFADGDVLCGKITPCFENGKLGIARGLKNATGFGSSEFVVMRPREALLSEFLYYFLSRDAFRSAGAGLMSGAVGHKRVPNEYFEALPIPLPPLEEQKRIVAALDQAFAALDRARANAEANLADAQELFGAALSGLSRSGSPSGRQPLRLGSIVTRLTNGYVGPIKNVYVDAGVPYLLARHVRDNTLNFDGKTYISPAFNEKHKKSKLKAGDVLLVQSGHIGHSAVVPQEHEGHNCHAMIVITPIASIVSGAYLSLMFNTPRMRARFEEIRSGSTVPHLTCKMVKDLTFDVPPRSVQDQIVAQAADLRHRTQVAMSQYRSKLSDIAALRQSLLQKAFAGELA